MSANVVGSISKIAVDNDFHLNIRGSLTRDQWTTYSEKLAPRSIYNSLPFASTIGTRARVISTLMTVETSQQEILAAVPFYIHVAKKHWLLQLFPFEAYIWDTPMFSASTRGVAAVNLLLQGLEQYALSLRIPQIELSPRYSQSHIPIRSLFDTIIAPYGYHKETVWTILMDLTKPQEELWTNMPKTLKRDIRRACEEEVTITDDVDIDEYYALHQHTVYRLGLKQEPFAFFQRVWNNLIPTGLVKAFGAMYKDQLIAACLILMDAHSREMYSWRAVSNQRYWRLRGNDLLFWTAAQWGKQHAYISFDLVHYGSRHKDNKYYSLYHYKKGFGDPVFSYRYTKILSTSTSKVFTKSYTLLNRLHWDRLF